MKKLFFIVAFIVCFGLYSNVYGETYSDAGLYANGVKNYNNNNWQYATIYLFALIQRNPKAFTSDPAFKQEVITAFDESMKRLAQQVSNSNVLIAQQTKKPPTDGLTASQSSLESKPPLRPANQVRL